jgi:phospholipase/carboxylesterase
MVVQDPHANANVIHRGTSLPDASAVIILLHGRGGSASDILSLGSELGFPKAALLAPQASERSWYPESFLAPIARNEPWLSSALHLVDRLVEQCETVGILPERVAICGFSQGACLATEFVARYPRRYAGLIGLTGGLIGPPGSDLRHPGSLAGTPVLMSSGDPDAHVPWQRVEESAHTLRAMGANVEMRRYPGRSHTILNEEVLSARDFLEPAMTRRRDVLGRRIGPE